MLEDLLVVGGGPAGLAAAIGAASRGLRVTVLEKRAFPVDKACGEGLMPAGLRALARLGALALLDPSECAPFLGIRYVQEDGSTAEARFAGDGGLGIRRTALSAALARRAAELGVALRPGATVEHHWRLPDRIGVEAGGERFEARLLVAADGLGSPLRHALGLDAPVSAPRRFGLRRHFQCADFDPFIEVHFAPGIEAYVTPAGPRRVGVAFLWRCEGIRKGSKPISFQSLLESFPLLRERLSLATPASAPRGAGPLYRSARARTADRVVLLGDAAGYVDALTGEGLSLAFHCAEVLAAILPNALARGATREALIPYERESAHAFQRYSRIARALLAISARPSLRRAIINTLANHPRIFDALLEWVSGDLELPNPLTPPRRENRRWFDLRRTHGQSRWRRERQSRPPRPGI